MYSIKSCNEEDPLHGSTMTGYHIGCLSRGSLPITSRKEMNLLAFMVVYIWEGIVIMRLRLRRF